MKNKRIEKIILLLILTMFTFCNRVKQNKGDMSKSMSCKSTNPIYIEFYPKCYVETSIKVFSKDSVIATVKFINDNDSLYYIDKRLIPDQNLPLKINLFNIKCIDMKINRFGDLSNQVWLNNPQFSEPSEDDDNLIKYYEITKIIDPILIKDSLFILNTRDSLIIENINLTKSYDFTPFLVKKENKFEIAYNSLMPHILQNLCVAKKYDSIERKNKIIYDEICPRNDKSISLKTIKFIINK